ncbi:hypothetical protein GBF38_010153 [Nibea albiflora]|uniref:Uncharacterized protein n=1 Tax=Nibea albiflora TaxID=240163 RepID=A0ACB7FCU7_NIBAL|nr:hypothetical protein GBF38_010153 [Nibea albiflora]
MYSICADKVRDQLVKKVEHLAAKECNSFHRSRFPVSGLSDGKWHHVAISVSAKRLALYVDCSLLESVDWVYHGMGISTDGLLMVGGIIEAFETPFENILLSSNDLEDLLGNPEGESFLSFSRTGLFGENNCLLLLEDYAAHRRGAEDKNKNTLCDVDTKILIITALGTSFRRLYPDET